jgi:putative copper resistance protein D
LLYSVVVLTTHLTPLILATGWQHDGEHLAYLVAGYLFFLPVAGSEPIRWRISMAGRYLMLLVAMPVDIAAGVILMLVPRELFPAYAHSGRAWGPSPLTDLHDGGTIMWAGGDIVMTVLALVVSFLLIHDRRQAGQLGGWIEGIRRTALVSRLAGAGVTIPPVAGADDEAQLAAYNTYLGVLGGTPPGTANRRDGGSDDRA